MSDMRIIKRYANRKLYDTRESRYVTLEQIAEMIRGSEDVKVVDNSSKEDLTSVTLAQIIFEEEKRQRSFLPLSALRKVIQSGGDSLHGFVHQLQDSALKVGRVFQRDEDEEAAEAEGEEAERADDAKSESKDPVKVVRELFDGVQNTFDDWQKRVDANFQSALDSVSPLAPLQKEVQALRERIAELEQKLADIEGAE